jgi:F-type H+-transporting ATPase subunit gamma
MANLKALRKRISSVRSTQQITKAMKMVSAAKLRRAQDAAIAARPYAEKLSELLSSVAAGVPSDTHPLLRSADERGRTHLLLITGDRGLCGAYNATLIRQAEGFFAKNASTEVSLSIVGKKGAEHFRRRGRDIAGSWTQIGTPSIELAREIGSQLTERIQSGEVDRIILLYSAFRSALTQIPTLEPLLPVEPQASEGDDQGTAPAEYLTEPNAASVLDRLLPQYVEVRVYHALLEAAASEHGSRMTAMDSATSNASEMIFRLTLQMNRARQAAITTELMEIVGGAEALKG